MFSIISTLDVEALQFGSQVIYSIFNPSFSPNYQEASFSSGRISNKLKPTDQFGLSFSTNQCSNAHLAASQQAAFTTATSSELAFSNLLTSLTVFQMRLSQSTCTVQIHIINRVMLGNIKDYVKVKMKELNTIVVTANIGINH